MAAQTKKSSYFALPTDERGFVNYSKEDDEVWEILYARQIEVIKGRACDEYLHGLDLLNLPSNRVAQIPEVSHVLQESSGWELQPVAAVIPFEEFFRLLAVKKFPAATFIRHRHDIDYLQEPDIFHEIFGHCPMLTDPTFANFVQKYGQLGLQASPKERVFLARLFWFTVEFGLINTVQGLRIYGAGILSSYSETLYALDNQKPIRVSFDLNSVLKTPYRIDHIQPIYYTIDLYQQLYDLANESIFKNIHQAIEAGLFSSAFLKSHSHDC